MLRTFLSKLVCSCDPKNLESWALRFLSSSLSAHHRKSAVSMSLLPLGAAMYYDVPPQYDSRHARALVKGAAKLVEDFSQAHGMGRDHPDPEFKKKANDLRSQLEAKRLELSDSCTKFEKKENQEKVATQVGKMQMSLDSHPPFDIPSPVAIDPDLANQFFDRIGEPFRLPPNPS